jgi:type I restriction enzyme M protein
MGKISVISTHIEYWKSAIKLPDSERSWSVNRQDIEANNYDIKAVNPNRKDTEDTRTPEELMDIIEAKGREVAEALASLRSRTKW